MIRTYCAGKTKCRQPATTNAPPSRILSVVLIIAPAQICDSDNPSSGFSDFCLCVCLLTFPYAGGRAYHNAQASRLFTAPGRIISKQCHSKPHCPYHSTLARGGDDRVIRQNTERFLRFRAHCFKRCEKKSSSPAYTRSSKPPQSSHACPVAKHVGPAASPSPRERRFHTHVIRRQTARCSEIKAQSRSARAHDAALETVQRLSQQRRRKQRVASRKMSHGADAPRAAVLRALAIWLCSSYTTFAPCDRATSPGPVGGVVVAHHDLVRTEPDGGETLAHPFQHGRQ